MIGTTVNNLTITKLIGTGAYGLVFQVLDPSTRISFAMKVTSTHSSHAARHSDAILKKLKSLVVNHHINATPLSLVKIRDLEPVGPYKELTLHLRVHTHPNIVSIRSIAQCQSLVFTVMDLYTEGDLFRAIVEDKIYLHSTPQLIKSVFTQLLDAVSYCHSRGIYHCDLKPENVLVADNGRRVALGDFGLSVTNSTLKGNICIGSSYYMAPERLLGVEHSEEEQMSFPASQGDVWSLCIILINLTCMRNPWSKACSLDQTYSNYIKNNNVLKEILPINDELFSVLVKGLRKDERCGLLELRCGVVNCSCFTTSGELSIPDTFLTPPATPPTHNQCLVPLDTEDYFSSPSYTYQKLLSQQPMGPIGFESDKFRYVDSSGKISGFMEKNCSVLTERSFVLNDTARPGYENWFGVR